MIRSSVTIALVPEAKGGPFVFWDDLASGCAKAAESGFDGVEVFPRGPEAVDKTQLQDLLAQHNLQFAAMGTGAGMVVHQLSLTNPDASIRAKAVDFIKSIIDFAGPLGTPAIIGSMQGHHGGEVSKEQALEWLSAGLNELGAHAAQHDVPLLYEPLNRYETNLFNRISEAADYLRTLTAGNVKILADLFHMNIEEPCIAMGIRDGGDKVGEASVEVIREDDEHLADRRCGGGDGGRGGGGSGRRARAGRTREVQVNTARLPPTHRVVRV